MAKQQQQLSQSTAAEEHQAGSGSDARQDDIAVAAYYRAEARGFAPGNEMHDWLEAEQAIQAGSTESR